ncbi:SRPBCC family protein [Candidatus Spongiisocius sp.]|uniref:SRPBCC family protein n=1 Tax=Candidatus Spongiisocius sp. TaxID=3101273 RepID=UPI003B5B57B5
MSESTVQTIEIDAPPARCFEVAADLEAYPEWAGGVRRVSVHEKDAQGRPVRATLVVDAMIRQVEVTFRYTFDPPRAIRWTAEPGRDILELDGSYEFRELGEGTTAVYMLRVVPGFDIPGFLRSQAEKQIVGTALRALRKRAEGS